MKNFPRQILAAQTTRLFFEPIKSNTEGLLRLWFGRWELSFGSRMRRGQQLFSHYRRIWQEKELLIFLTRFRRQLAYHTKGFVLMAAPFVFDWNKERIPLEVMLEHKRELEYTQRLKQNTLYCPACKKRRKIDQRLVDVDYCECGANEPVATMDEWEPYLERKNVIIWRKPNQRGHFSYKLYGRYEDVTAEDFFHVQTNVDYRKEWDKSAITLNIIDSDPVKANNCHVLYWEMLWPKLFANRDYVFQRRTLVDRKEHVMVVVSQSMDHPDCPVQAKNQRVVDYWSVLIIKPLSNFRRPGLEFVLTYFDNPGIVIPPTVSTWVAKKQMPDFLQMMHDATIRYSKSQKAAEHHDEQFSDYDDAEEDSGSDYFWNYQMEPGFEYPPEPEVNFEHVVGKESPRKERRSSRGDRDEDQKSSSSRDGIDNKSQVNLHEEETVKTEVNERSSWWSYLHPYSYFA